MYADAILQNTNLDILSKGTILDYAYIASESLNDYRMKFFHK